MTLPALKSVELGERLRTLHGDDGALLAEILRTLAQEVEREPRNLIASTAYGHALVLAGKAAEARREARRALELWRSLPAVPPAVTLNVVAGLADAGLAAEAKRTLESLADRRVRTYLSSGRTRVRAVAGRRTAGEPRRRALLARGA
ncbi:hypothetical protein [Nannocystis pusilla]|uniref:hypothetical protein n=1 Tax=Nannocystis pusilla TaxID=889268 RepID=UPI003BEF68A2